MTKSEELFKEALEEDNDLKSMGIYRKASREARYEKFSDIIEPLLKKGINVTEHAGQGKFTLEPTNFGILDFYPKANKVLIRKTNTWKTSGTAWIVRNLLTSN